MKPNVNVNDNNEINAIKREEIYLNFVDHNGHHRYTIYVKKNRKYLEYIFASASVNM